MNRCPNCQYEVAADDRYCHRCGMDMMWDPNLGPPGRPSDWVQVFLGVLAAFASIILGPLGIIIVLAIYLNTKGSGSAFARGLGIGLIILAALLFGAIALCIALIATWK